ncbi:unnamed protein product [Pseudo-nitzschia multistriata]|uniref:Uncharacterized protein n=1 Tax=Pseudo-nitzschia multistriata TaxID=183589 RepID=A0A448ZNH8_9STRA|nr:unnamed protein product [Pseudo-nitzschia multistriata]
MASIAGVLICTVGFTDAFSAKQQSPLLSSTRLGLIPPPGSGYAGPEEEIDVMPDTYEPMMEYPGTMRPGRTPENMPFHDLPIGDDDPDPVPWPHFQQIEWHHRWAPPHPHPTPMEEFIEQQGRWATPEMEAEMRTGSRRASRTRREMEEEQKRDTLIMDDDEDDDDFVDDFPQELGEGMFGQLGSTDDAKITADAVSPDRMNDDKKKSKDDDDDDADDDAGLDDFLLDLGLDSLGDDDDDDDDKAQPAKKKSSTKSIGLEDVMFTEDDDDDEEEENVNPDVTASIDVDDDDDDLELGLDDDDDLDDSMEVPLEDFGDDDNDMDADNFFDDGGFDYGDGDGGGDFDGGFD